MLALYRKYRPKKLSDIFGQETNVEILKNAAKTGRIAHAYLFYGPRGTGKTSTARILSKIANCEKIKTDESFRQKGEPCNECHACLEIETGRALDIVEIDAASNRGIDEIRSLQEGIKLSPASLSFKVFIIDEVHMLTAPAFNALLKTLEEPPAHAIFILATTEIEKVPATITSRTQKFVFKKVSIDLLVSKLKSIAEKENITIEENALTLVARAAEGSVRDSESLLDQISSFLGNSEKITLEKTEDIIGKTGFHKIAELLSATLEKNAEKSLSFISGLKEKGQDIVQFNKDLINSLGKLLALKANEKMEMIFKKEMTDSELEEIKNLAKKFELENMLKLVKLLISAHREMRYSPFPSVPLEVALIEFINS
ncbi:MAG: DNA polymerase III, subunit gamma and tau [Candidatus Liptonbacteria bacterium RIFOXYC1_FULL_36_8]|uniref:DNA polymerase III subunit gamma/tau n=1 Tax=Candidatus Liptonbacteria bacterium RIFOXYC1_FULL_36_8 TaxID=1798655 RepID=A0A1G2CUI8_9BACT|nr:MAG: DNA polymerase III, subunit gamma and tau [Candidatus Liptonbacteria bacterium RIFOXYC1_FULL_36_8]